MNNTDIFNDTSRYNDIIDLPRPPHCVHAPMPLAERAAQFSSFAALRGHDDALATTARRLAEAYDRAAYGCSSSANGAPYGIPGSAASNAVDSPSSTGLGESSPHSR